MFLLNYYPYLSLIRRIFAALGRLRHSGSSSPFWVVLAARLVFWGRSTESNGYLKLSIVVGISPTLFASTTLYLAPPLPLPKKLVPRSSISGFQGKRFAGDYNLTYEKTNGL